MRFAWCTPCTGRIDRAMMLKAFAKGADGVALVGCEPASAATAAVPPPRSATPRMCRRSSTSWAWAVSDCALPPSCRRRPKRCCFSSRNSARIFNALARPGSWLRRWSRWRIRAACKQELQQLVATYDIHACQDCGKCSSACPLALIGKPFSPRAIAAVITGGIHAPGVCENAWSCLTCGLCYERCPSAVNFPAFIKELRHLYRQSELPGREVRGGFSIR